MLGGGWGEQSEQSEQRIPAMQLRLYSCKSGDAVVSVGS